MCQASLQGGHLEMIQRTGAKLLDAKGAVLATGVGVHQTALYDMILAWILFAILWNMNKKPRREGVLALTFGLYYGCARLLEDSLRIDKRFWAVHGLAVDRAHGRHHLCGDLDLVGLPPGRGAA